MDKLIITGSTWIKFFSDFTVEIVAAAFITVMPAIYKLIRRIITRIKTRRFEKGIEKVYKIYGSFQELSHELSATKVMLMKATNGGGLPAPGRPLHVTAVVEVAAPGVKMIREEWQDRIVDHSYIQVLERVYVDDHVEIKTKELEEFSTLKGVLEASGTVQTSIQKVGVIGDGFYFLSVQWNKERKISTADVYAMESEIDTLKKII